jgi:hypothetical protein
VIDHFGGDLITDDSGQFSKNAFLFGNFAPPRTINGKG